MKNSLTILATCILALAISLTTRNTCIAQQTTSTLKSKGYADVNGIKMYYEVHGEGEPIVLLHGAYMNIHLNWNQLVPELVKTHKVIAFELQGHGHTPLGNRPYAYKTLATDVAEALKFLKVRQADIAGYSFGGTIAYQLAIQNPELVKSLIIISSTYKYVGWQTEAQHLLKDMKPEYLSGEPLKSEYVAAAPDSTQWIPFLNKLVAFNSVDYNLGDENIKNLKMPVLLIAGDNDGIDKPTLFQTYKALGGGVFADMAGFPKSQLAILPGQSHGSLMMNTSGIYNAIKSFLK